MGSSPLARGTSQVTHLISLEVRLIPARAGSTKLTPVTPAVSAAHPRSRGEHPSPGSPEITIDGSSPLTRGTPAHLTDHDVSRGLIPTRAGNILLPLQISGVRSAHPRYCGEHTSPTRPDQSSPGSSPLARGTMVAPIPHQRPARLIPARAGNILQSASWCLHSSAHPRSRGEHAAEMLQASTRAGSSPLARGTLRQKPCLHHRQRLIPARAGNMSGKPALDVYQTAHPRSRGEHI